MEKKSEHQQDEQSCAPAPIQDALNVASAGTVPDAISRDSAADGTEREAGAETSAIPAEELNRMTDDMIAAIKTVYDPEIPVDIFELGLIYKIDVEDDRSVEIDMTLTAPGCPVAGEMPGWVEDAVRSVEGVRDVKVNLVFEPPWDISRMSDEARVALNMW